MPLISVHLCVRDSAHTLRRAVTSTLASLPVDAELVVLDDASQDRPQEAIADVVDPRVRLITRRESQGIGAARQKLLECTDSRYVATMDADDISLPARFGAQLRALEAGHDFVFAPVISFWPNSRRIRPGLPMPITVEAMPLHMLVHNLLCNPTMAAKRSTVNAVGGYRRVLAEDHDLWLRALAAGANMVRIARPVLAYRHHEKQTSVQRDFLGTAFREAPLREAYVDFVERRFGLDPTWLDVLWSETSGTEAVRSGLRPLQRLLEQERRGLGLVQRAVLRRTERLLDMRVEAGSRAGG